MIYSVSLNWLNVNFIIFTKLVTLTTLIHCTLQCTAGFLSFIIVLNYVTTQY